VITSLIYTIRLISLRGCLARLLWWLSGLISHKSNQMAISANALFAKATRKPVSRPKHAPRCFSSFGGALLRISLCALKPKRNYPPSATMRPTCPAPDSPTSRPIRRRRRLSGQRRASLPAAPAQDLPRRPPLPWPCPAASYHAPPPSSPSTPIRGGGLAAEGA
jgi:hypothetical protein